MQLALQLLHANSRRLQLLRHLFMLCLQLKSCSVFLPAQPLLAPVLTDPGTLILLAYFTFATVSFSRSNKALALSNSSAASLSSPTLLALPVEFSRFSRVRIKLASCWQVSTTPRSCRTIASTLRLSRLKSLERSSIRFLQPSGLLSWTISLSRSSLSHGFHIAPAAGCSLSSASDTSSRKVAGHPHSSSSTSMVPTSCSSSSSSPV
mmetsp:Transcript_1392/g.3046  ORF Transcript_1392/g.3046 Transcript_1392/m.3046 type:complete len:207 (-) Transcript_1392:1716-2336(-)